MLHPQQRAWLNARMQHLRMQVAAQTRQLWSLKTPPSNVADHSALFHASPSAQQQNPLHSLTKSPAFSQLQQPPLDGTPQSQTGTFAFPGRACSIGHSPYCNTQGLHSLQPQVVKQHEAISHYQVPPHSLAPSLLPTPEGPPLQRQVFSLTAPAATAPSTISNSFLTGGELDYQQLLSQYRSQQLPQYQPPSPLVHPWSHRVNGPPR